MAMRWRCPPDKGDAALTDDRLIAIFELHDEIVRLSIVRGLFNGCACQLSGRVHKRYSL